MAELGAHGVGGIAEDDDVIAMPAAHADIAVSG